MKNLFLVIFISFGIVYYYLHKNYWSKVTDFGYTRTEQTEGEIDTLNEENAFTKSKETFTDSIRVENKNKPAL